MKIFLLTSAILTFSMNCSSQTKQFHDLVGNTIGVSTFGDDDWAIGLVKSPVQTIPVYDTLGNQTVTFIVGRIGYIANQSGSFNLYQFKDTCHSFAGCIKLVQKTSIDGSALKEFGKTRLNSLSNEKLIKLSGGTVLMDNDKAFYVGEDSSEYTIHVITKDRHHFTSFNANWFSEESPEGFKQLHKEGYIANRSTTLYRTFLQMLQILDANLKE